MKIKTIKSKRSVVGLKRGTVKLVPHNPKWRKLFEKEEQLIRKTFGSTIIAIEHIGSTSIFDIIAKPILDINIGVRSLKTAKSMKKKFKKLGYKHRPFKLGHTKEDLKRRELYIKGPESKHTHHVHVTIYKSEYWNNDILFRDYLRLHPKHAQKYAKLKKKLALQHANDRETYTKNKIKFISETIKRARGRTP